MVSRPFGNFVSFIYTGRKRVICIQENEDRRLSACVEMGVRRNTICQFISVAQHYIVIWGCVAMWRFVDVLPICLLRRIVGYLLGGVCYMNLGTSVKRYVVFLGCVQRVCGVFYSASIIATL